MTKTRPYSFRFFFPSLNTALTFDATAFQDAEAECRNFLNRCGPVGQAILRGTGDIVITYDSGAMAA